MQIRKTYKNQNGRLLGSHSFEIEPVKQRSVPLIGVFWTPYRWDGIRRRTKTMLLLMQVHDSALWMGRSTLKLKGTGSTRNGRAQKSGFYAYPHTRLCQPAN